jgi:hypothetical protein
VVANNATTVLNFGEETALKLVYNSLGEEWLQGRAGEKKSSKGSVGISNGVTEE